MGTLTISNLGKAYKKYPTRWSRLWEWLTLGGRQYHNEKWVLKDINFTVNAGEAVGIVGINGAGKSTLLKVISGTTQPTTGSVQTTGKVVAMLELGMGFHPDFTGRQNVFLAGQLLGMGYEEIARLMPEIEAFAEIGDYIDQPTRVYSSGMQMRLAFSLATSKRPDILIVDEALSVGDAYFQHKSFERIREFRKQGTTLLIVSHDKQAIVSICDRAILLSEGNIHFEGNPESTMDTYNALLAGTQAQALIHVPLTGGKLQTVSGTGQATVESISICDIHGNSVEVVDVGQKVRLQVSVKVHSDIPRLVFGYGIKDRLGQVVYGTNTHLTKQAITDAKAGQKYIFDVTFEANLGVQTYSVQTSLSSTETHLVNNYEWRDLALFFSVVNIAKPHFIGGVWLEPEINISLR